MTHILLRSEATRIAAPRPETPGRRRRSGRRMLDDDLAEMLLRRLVLKPNALHARLSRIRAVARRLLQELD